jgi:hypothetical protein
MMRHGMSWGVVPLPHTMRGAMDGFMHQKVGLPFGQGLNTSDQTIHADLHSVR